MQFFIYDKIVTKLSMLYNKLSKVLSNLAHAETNARCPKTVFSATSLIQNQFPCVIKHLWEIFCEFSIVIYANIRACIKLIVNHAKKSSLNKKTEAQVLPHIACMVPKNVNDGPRP